MKPLRDYFFDDFVKWLDTKPFYVMLLTVIVPVILIGWGAMALGLFTFGDDHRRADTNVKVDRVHTSVPPTLKCLDLDRIAEEIIKADTGSAPTTTTLVPTTTTLACRD